MMSFIIDRIRNLLKKPVPNPIISKRKTVYDFKNSITVYNLKEYVNEYNWQWPIDRWWREKHKISFNSSLHREANFIDMTIEFLEDKMYRKFQKEDDKEKDYYLRGSKSIFKPYEQETDQQISSQTFENIDLSIFDEITKNKKK